MIDIRTVTIIEGNGKAFSRPQFVDSETGQEVMGVCSADVRLRVAEPPRAEVQLIVEKLDIRNVDSEFFTKMNGKEYKLVEVKTDG